MLTSHSSTSHKHSCQCLSQALPGAQPVCIIPGRFCLQNTGLSHTQLQYSTWALLPENTACSTHSCSSPPGLCSLRTWASSDSSSKYQFTCLSPAEIPSPRRTSLVVCFLGPAREGLCLGRGHCALVQGRVRVGPGRQGEGCVLICPR